MQVRETIPDSLLAGSTVVHLVDLHPEALRELALRRMAEGVEETLERYMAEHDISGPWAATETVMACIAGRPLTGRVLRQAWRLARGLNANFIAVHVCRSRLDQLAEHDRLAIARNIELAEDLGAEVVLVGASDIVQAILDVARERNVTQIVVGHSPRPRWQERVGRSLVSELIRTARGYDIHVVAEQE